MSERDIRYPRLGEQVTRLVRRLAAEKGWGMGFAMDYVANQAGYGPDLVHRWRQGRSRPSDEALETLVQLGKNEANLDREWAKSLLNAAHYPGAAATVNELWGPEEMRPIPCNLPPPQHRRLIGRQDDIRRLLELLSPRYAAPLITVDGIGGVGKTALALEVAHLCRKASTGEEPNPQVPAFDAIVFFSAKQQRLTPDGILSRYAVQRTLRGLFHEVANTLQSFDILSVAPADQPPKVREILAQQRTLLIVDNLETMEDVHEIVSFLYELPPSVKVVITTRERTYSFSPLRLKELPEEEALRLIEEQAHEREVVVDSKQARELYQIIGGIPAALVYAVGQLARGYSMERVIGRVRDTSGDVARFYFQGSVETLRGRAAHALLMAISMFPKPPLLSALTHTAGLAADSIAMEEGLAGLRQLSLVNQRRGGRYEMLPLTREYALSELAAHPGFEREAGTRWVKWYLDFTKEYGGDDWEEWHVRYDSVEEEWENLLAIFAWCAGHNRYDDMRTFWLPGEGMSGGVLEFSTMYGYWGDRVTWLGWLNQEAERRGDWPTAVDALSRKGFTLTLMGQLREASELLKRAWELHKHATLLVGGIQVNLAQNISMLHIYERNNPEALSWFDRAEVLLDTASLQEPELSRWWINAQYHRGILYYEQGVYDQAERCFRDVVTHGGRINWQRSVIYAQNFLADIALAQGRLDEAEHLLQVGKPVAERNKDRRRTAHYQHSFARLYQQQGEVDEAYRQGKEALDGFKRLGMQKEIQQVEKLLEKLQK